MTGPGTIARLDRARARFRDKVTQGVDDLRRHQADDPGPPPEVIATIHVIARLTYAQTTLWLATALAMLSEVLPDTRPACPDGVDEWAQYNCPVPPPCSEHGEPCTGDCYDQPGEAHDAA